MSYLTAQSGSDGLADNSMEFVVFFCDKQDISAIKVDVRMNREYQLVLHHDALEEGQQYVALEDVFAYIARENSPIRINCDLKESGLEEAVYKLADKYALWPQVELSGTVACRFLSKWSNQILMNIENGMDDSFHGEHIGRWGENVLLEALSKLARSQAKIININHQLFTDAVKEKGKLLELEFSLWTVNDLIAIENYEKENIYNITTRKAWAYIQQKGAQTG
ncbi:MAG: glycerophosphodiester phosphodiesterase [Trichococcus sp.]|uniref:glycerophosphodiester phosphodiesterase n=1 Tax=Trichococcus sp. TaxID=1985464 RepID=UPI003C40F07B